MSTELQFDWSPVSLLSSNTLLFEGIICLVTLIRIKIDKLYFTGNSDQVEEVTVSLGNPIKR